MFFKEFQDLRRKADRRLGLPDLLNYGFAEDDHTIVMKDGARLAAFECHGSDLNSASTEELDAHRALANRAFVRLDDGFAYQVDLIRYPSAEYPEQDVCRSGQRDDRPRGGDALRAGRAITTKPDACSPSPAAEPRPSRPGLGGAFISGAGSADREREREWFKQQLQEFVDAISPVWKLTPLDLSALLSHITSCINGRMCQVKAPAAPVPLDAVLGNQDFVPGFKPRIGGRHIRVVSLSGFPPFSHAELALFLAELPLSYRYSIRAIPLGLRTSVSQLGVLRRNWFQKRKGARAMFSESIGSGAGAAFENQHALRMAADADDAIAEAEGGAVRFCYVTPKIILTGDTAAEADESAQLVFKVCQNMGFDPRIETPNANEALARLDSDPRLVRRAQAVGQYPQPGRHHAADQHLAGSGDQSMSVLSAEHAGALLWRDHRQHAFPLQSPSGDTGHTIIEGPTGAARASRSA